MNKKLLIALAALVLAAVLVVGGVHLAQLRAKHSQAPVAMMIATDMHYLSPALLGDSELYHAPAAAMDGKLVHYSPQALDALVAAAAAQQPAVLIISGDLTLNGAVQSHTEVAAKLAALQAAGVQVLVIPGNHDVDGQAIDYSGATAAEAEAITSQAFVQLYRQFGRDQALAADEASFSYVYELTPWLRILMLDVNCYGRGMVKDGTLAWLEGQLADAEKAGAEVMLVCHQNLYAHNQNLSFGYQIYNAGELLALLEDSPVVCCFSGHIHTQSIVEGEGIPEIVTASMALHEARWGEVVYSGKELVYTAKSLDVAAWAAAVGSTDENMLEYSSYARWYFEEVARQQVRESLAESGLATGEIELLADTFARINSAYFVGEPIDAAEYTQGLALWQQQGGFVASYIDTMLEASEGKLALTVKLK